MAEPEADQHRSRLTRLKTKLLLRDWMGIAIEIAIVTLGVLIAFQVDQWGSDWQLRTEERLFLDRVYRENGQSISELRTIVPTHQTSAAELGMVLRSRNDPSKLQLFARREGFGCGAATQSRSGFSDSAYEELLESGRLQVVGDPQLRDQLRELAASHAAGVRERDFTRQLVQVLLPEINEYYQFTLGPRPELTCHMDWPALIRNERAVNAIALAYRVQQILARSRGNSLEVAEKTQARLACALKKPECKSA